jgi:hypothetical protein
MGANTTYTSSKISLGRKTAQVTTGCCYNRAKYRTCIELDSQQHTVTFSILHSASLP